MTNSPIDRVRGMVDVLPDERLVQRAVGAQLEAHSASFGYRLLDLPVLEHTDLYLRKVGQEMAAKLYAFRHHNRDLCLRPEFTASVMRTFVTSYQNAPLPLRLAYSGPVFRYEAPGRLRYRQFTEVGVELIGAASPAADAEIIALAADGLARLGLTDYQIVIGHIGIAQAYLAGLALDDRVRDWLTWSMEDLRRHDVEQIHHALGTLAAGDEPVAAALAAVAPADGWRSIPVEQAEQLVLLVVSGVGLDLSGSRRSPAEIAQRLVRKLTHQRAPGDVDRALVFLRRLARLRGRPAAVLEQVRALLAEEGQPDTAITHMAALLENLTAHGVDPDRVTFDAGLGRGLHFYTGLVFEIYDGADGGQLAGGGRYDDLATVLGARERTPACGFAYGLERVVEALQTRGLAPRPSPTASVLVCAVSEAETAHAVRVARELRRQGHAVELDVRGRGVRANLEAANRRGLTHVAIVGAEEQAANAYTWRDMVAKTQEQRPLPQD